MYTSDYYHPKPRKSVIRMDPDCAICHAPATLSCDCEAKGLDMAVRQAESRMMQSIYNDIRYVFLLPLHRRGTAVLWPLANLRPLSLPTEHGYGHMRRTTSWSTSDSLPSDGKQRIATTWSVSRHMRIITTMHRRTRTRLPRPRLS